MQGTKRKYIGKNKKARTLPPSNSMGSVGGEGCHLRCDLGGFGAQEQTVQRGNDQGRATIWQNAFAVTIVR